MTRSQDFRDDLNIITLMFICSASCMLTWLAIIGWWFKRFGGLLFLSVAVGCIFSISLVGVLWSVRYERACRVASKLKTLSLVSATALYVSLWFFGVSISTNVIAYILGFAVALVGLAFRLWAVAEKADVPDDTVVTSGPYSVVRHPRYLGTALAVFGACLTVEPFFLVFLLALLPLVLHTASALREEDHLSMQESTRQAYRGYASQVPRFFPSLESIVRLPPPHSLKRLLNREHRWKKSELSSTYAAVLLILFLGLTRALPRL